MKLNRNLIFVVAIAIIAGVLNIPKSIDIIKPINLNLFGKNIEIKFYSPEIHLKLGRFSFNRNLEIKKGLDLQGGSQLVLRADMSEIEDGSQSDALISARDIISRRVDLYGVAESSIQTSQVNEEHRILVELPGIEEVDQAIELIGKTAQLDFRELPEEMKESTQSTIFDFVSTGLGGQDLKKASVSFDNQSVAGGPVVSLEFSSEGAKKFAEITQRNIDQPVGIFLDEYPVTLPRVNEAITTGQAVISGDFDIDSAKELAIQLNAGALPVPIEVIEQRTIGPSLGQESIDKSVRAGLIGLAIVMAFMIALYGKLGIISSIALVIYGLVTLAIYKLVPVTLTLPGIAGLILSIGMAVDSNILIFERMKEEKRSGRTWSASMEMGFGKAWDSIKDANLATILTALILFNPFNWSFLVTSGMVRGFALTLLLGTFISMFTGVFVSRVLIRAFFGRKDK
jgi:preprotein translocase subunit SecD